MTNELWHLDAEGSGLWVFPQVPDGAVNQYVDFLQEFECESPPGDGELLVSADTDFTVWLNGEFVGSGQYPNHPDEKTYEGFSLSGLLRNGRNTIAVTVFYNGRTSSVYERGDAGVVFLVRGDQVLAASGPGTLCRTNPCYHSGPIAVVSRQLAYTFGYDARGDDGFPRSGSIDGAGWRPVLDSEATLPAGRSVLRPRPVPRLVDGGRTWARLHECGRFRLAEPQLSSDFEGQQSQQTAAGMVLPDGTVVGPAEQMYTAHLAPVPSAEILGVDPGTVIHALERGLAPAQTSDPVHSDADPWDGTYLIFDLGQEEVGYLELEIDAPDGTILDMGYGEHLDDGRVRTSVGGRSFAGRYICRSGRQIFHHQFLRWAGRYLEIIVHGGRFTLHRFGLRRREYQVQLRGRIETGQSHHQRILQVGYRTLHLCMHEHYEDTPWREQALYANDARIQALCGYYAFREIEMPAASFSLLGRGLRDDGLLNLCAPGQPQVTIPSFTFAWMLAVRDHYLYSGDDRLAREFLPQATSMLKAFLSERRDGLLPLRNHEDIWHFYDWTEGMSGYTDEDSENGPAFDLPLNCFLILALEAIGEIHRWCEIEAPKCFAVAADEIREAAAARFWSAVDGAFVTHENAASLSELTQALAVLARVGDDGMQRAALAGMVHHDPVLVPATVSQSLYTFDAMMSRKDEFGPEVLRRIETTWGAMLDAGATTFWETGAGARDFDNAGSLCHGWSAVPVYVFYHHILGIRPLEPGFAVFAFDPLSQVVPDCAGTIPVPSGEIHVNWRTTAAGVTSEVHAPAGLTQVAKTLSGD